MSPTAGGGKGRPSARSDRQSAWFRCYAELNDFLPAHRRQRDIEVLFQAPAPVRHLMETLGVPHTEVELILVNGESVDLERPIASGDRVSLYPMFEAMDISPLLRLRQDPMRQTRFVADAHLGKLARLLRLLGFDTLFENDCGDDALVQAARMGGRILLTRDRALLMRREADHGCFIRAVNPEDQLRYVVRRLDLFRQFRPFTRCMRCNGGLEPVEREEVAAGLPPAVYRAFDRFWRCGGCGQVYWRGSHYERLRGFVRRLESVADAEPSWALG